MESMEESINQIKKTVQEIRWEQDLIQSFFQSRCEIETQEEDILRAANRRSREEFYESEQRRSSNAREKQEVKAFLDEE